MYEYRLDGKTIYYPGDAECVIRDPVVNLNVNEAGYAEFKLPHINPLYGSVENRKSMLSVLRNGSEIFYGEVRENGRDSDIQRNVYAVGALAFLGDSIQPQHNYGDATPAAFMQAVLAVHNAQVEDRKKIYFGSASVPGSYSMADKITDYNSTLDALRSQLVDRFGGCLKITRNASNGKMYLHYVPLTSYGNTCTQRIEFGENLLDYSDTLTASDICTAVIPLARTEGSPDSEFSEFIEYLDITEATHGDGNNYVYSAAGVASFGWVWRTVEFEVDNADDLRDAGLQYLSDAQYETLTLTLTAVDLSAFDASIDDIGIGDLVTVSASPYGMERAIPVQELELHPQDPASDTVVLSATLQSKRTLTGALAASTSALSSAAYKQDRTIRQMIKQELDAITAQFTGSKGGYKVSEFDSNGLWVRDLYMDTPNKATAQNVMQISMAGIAFSTNGYAGPYTSAWTLDGKFVADFIAAGSLLADLIMAGTLKSAGANPNFSLDLSTGAVVAKMLSIASTYFNLAQNGHVSMTGADITNGSITMADGLKKAIFENGFIRGYMKRTNSNTYDLSGLLDLSPNYSDNYKHAALWGKDILHLQAGGSEGHPSVDLTIDSNGLDAGGASGSFSNDAISITVSGGIVTNISVPSFTVPSMPNIPSGPSGQVAIDGYEITLDNGIITDIEDTRQTQ